MTDADRRALGRRLRQRWRVRDALARLVADQGERVALEAAIGVLYPGWELHEEYVGSSFAGDRSAISLHLRRVE